MTSSVPSAPIPPGSDRARPQIAFESVDLETIARHMYALMLRNVASDGFVFRDPYGLVSKPGCIIAAPSYPGLTPGIDQDYVYHWVRDAAITIDEIAAAEAGADGDAQPLVDYVGFAQLCQRNAVPTLAHAVFKVDGTPRPWTEQSDGPAVQTLAILGFYDRLDPANQATARAVMQVNVDYLVGAYDQPTRNLWEEKDGPLLLHPLGAPRLPARGRRQRRRADRARGDGRGDRRAGGRARPTLERHGLRLNAGAARTR